MQAREQLINHGKKQDGMQKREDAVANFDKKAALGSISETQRYGAESEWHKNEWENDSFEWPLMSELEVKND